MDVSSGAPHFPVAASVVLGAGFLTAVILGSVAWYNSRRPVGWEDKERPDFVPEIKEE
uniref:photosystem II assembly protein Psb35 n=1 Tax=Petrachloros mirabilis TaxID=2918835 RepID=UPI003B8479D0